MYVQVKLINKGLANLSYKISEGLKQIIICQNPLNNFICLYMYMILALNIIFKILQISN